MVQRVAIAVRGKRLRRSFLPTNQRVIWDSATSEMVLNTSVHGERGKHRADYAPILYRVYWADRGAYSYGRLLTDEQEKESL